MLFVGLVEPLDLAVRLGPTDLTERMLEIVLGEIGLEDVVGLALLIALVGVELRSVIGDHFVDLPVGGRLFTDCIEELDGRVA